MDTITYNGQKYELLEQASLSNRSFPGDFQSAEEGEQYTAEYWAAAKDSDGNDVTVYWQFDEVKGQEPEDESQYDFSTDNIVKVA